MAQALLLLRAEKAIIAGKDTDGTSMPHDLGVSGPRDKRQSTVGKRSLFTENASRPDRQRLVGLTVAAQHRCKPARTVSKRRVASAVRRLQTSNYFSPTLNRPIALGLIERGAERMGEEIAFVHLGKTIRAVIAQPCAFDVEGARLNG
jgi:sarcosine oxidase subunit alpha